MSTELAFALRHNKKVGFYFIQNDFGLGVAKFILNSLVRLIVYERTSWLWQFLDVAVRSKRFKTCYVIQLEEKLLIARQISEALDQLTVLQRKVF